MHLFDRESFTVPEARSHGNIKIFDKPANDLMIIDRIDTTGDERFHISSISFK
jgi:hypothetical protein